MTKAPLSNTINTYISFIQIFLLWNIYQLLQIWKVYLHIELEPEISKKKNNGNSSKIFNGAEKRKLIPEEKSFALAVFFIQNHSV